MEFPRIISHSERKARTRSLIQVGGLVEKSGLLDALGIVLGSDLQKDDNMKIPTASLLGALIEAKKSLLSGESSKELWALKGKDAFSNFLNQKNGETNESKHHHSESTTTWKAHL